MKTIKLFLIAMTSIFLVACGNDEVRTPVYAPGAPTAVSVSVGPTAGTTASISFTAPADSGSSAITGYTVTANPGGVTATGSASPIALTGLTPQTAYTYSVVATNSVGNSPSATTGLLNFYSVVETFYEPAYHPGSMMYMGTIKDTIFTGTFTFDSTNKTVSNLNGSITQAMTGPPMNTRTLANQLSSVPVTLGGVSGLLVTTFKLTTLNTLKVISGSDGWSPGTGTGLYYGQPTGVNPENAYAMIFVNTTDPTTGLVQAQLDRLAYADCTPGSMMMMGTQCMTGTTAAVYGSVGTMGGYPITQATTKL
jgi:hypothetical protein